MGNSIEQYRSAIGANNTSGRQRESARKRRQRVLSEIFSILAVAQIKNEARQVTSYIQIFNSKL